LVRRVFPTRARRRRPKLAAGHGIGDDWHRLVTLAKISPVRWGGYVGLQLA